MIFGQKTSKHNLCNLLKIRANIIEAIRDFFREEGFLEVETPTLVTAPDPNPYNEVFEIQNKDSERTFLIPSPEFFLKKLLVAGLKNIYQITKAYRDQQEKDPLHLREFTILEWYRTEADYTDLMKDCENLVNFIQKRLRHQTQNAKRPPALLRNAKRAGKTQNDNVKLKTLIYRGEKINLTPPWLKISCQEAFEKYAKVNLDEFLDIKKAKKICRLKGYQVNEKNSWEELYHQVFLNEVEPELKKMPTVILYDYPAPLAALAKLKKSDPKYAERFEFYLGGLELGNGYSELTDWREQERRLINDIRIRRKKRMKVFDYDHEFIEALKKGMPKTAGIAVGVDRLIMLFTDSTDIHKVTPVAK